MRRRGTEVEEDDGQNLDGNVLDDLEGDKADEHDDVDEGRRPKALRRPQTPTKAEWDEHVLTHLPFREWCPHCVAGKGVSSHHKTSKEPQLGLTVSVDYCWMKDGREERE